MGFLHLHYVIFWFTIVFVVGRIDILDIFFSVPTRDKVS